LLTQCPNCQTVFRVTSTILRAAHGQVRCGRCNNQFDAIENLLEGEDALVADNTDSITADQSSTHHESEPVSHEDIVLEGNRIEISGVYRRPDDQLDDGDNAAAHSRTIIEEFNISTEEWEIPFEHGDEVDTETGEVAETELDDVEQEISAAEIADAMASLEPDHVAPTNDERHDIAPTNDGANIVFTQPLSSAVVTLSDDSAADTLDDELFGRRPSPRRWPWVVASFCLTLLLMTQAVHHARAALARHPSIGPQIMKLYAAIGQPLAPQWQLQAYSIKQWGIISDPQEPGTLRVRASVTNRASFAQPYPLLQLSLEDRFGGEVGTRNFNPEEYLSNQTLATRLLGAGEAANIDLAIVDPGREAVGFQFDTCLQLVNNQLQCTHDLPPSQ